MNTTEFRSILQEILSQIAPEADLNEVGLEEDLRESLDIDSMDHLNLILGIHERLGIEIPESDYGQLTTLNGIYQYLQAKEVR